MIIMYDICKFYPIWLPPVKDDVLTVLGKQINAAIRAFNEGLPCTKDLTENIRKLGEKIALK
jgi:hypothetical protein